MTGYVERGSEAHLNAIPFKQVDGQPYISMVRCMASANNMTIDGAETVNGGDFVGGPESPSAL